MKIIQIKSSSFSARDVNGDVTCPENVLSKMSKEVLSACPDDVNVKDLSNTTVISRGNKRINVSAWQFDLDDWPNGYPFNYFLKDGSEKVIVFGISFIEDGKFRSDVNEDANYKLALGFTAEEERKALFMLGTKAMQYARSMSQDIRAFMSDGDSALDLIISYLPDGTKILKRNDISFTASVPLRDYDVRVSYSDGRFTATIPHKYTQTDRVYGAVYRDYSKTVNFDSPEDVEDFDWDSLWEDLYENRHGKCLRSGSLGS